MLHVQVEAQEMNLFESCRPGVGASKYLTAGKGTLMAVTWVQVEAEAVPDVTEKLGITVVPYFAILKARTVL